MLKFNLINTLVILGGFVLISTLAIGLPDMNPLFLIYGFVSGLILPPVEYVRKGK